MEKMYKMKGDMKFNKFTFDIIYLFIYGVFMLNKIV